MGVVATRTALTVAPFTGPAAPFVAIAATVSGFFHGADPRQIPAAKIEQAFELAADNLYWLAGANKNLSEAIISKQEAVDGINLLTQAAIQYEQQASQQYQPASPGQYGALPFSKAIANVQAVNGAEAQAVAGLPDLPLKAGPINFTEAQQYFYSREVSAGWYPESIAGAEQLTLTYLQSLNRSVVGTLSNSLNSIGNTIETALSSLTGGMDTAGLQATLQQNSGLLLTGAVITIVILLLRKA